MHQQLSRRRMAVVAASASSLAIAALVLGATSVGASTRDPRAEPSGAVVKVRTSTKYGKVLVNASGRTLYLLTSETSKSLECTGGCLGLWPPLRTTGRPRAGTGIVAKELGTVKRGSSLQVTYYGHPLYLYSGDTAAGDVNGEGSDAGVSRGTWYVLTGAGSPVKSARTSSGGGGGGGW